MTDLRRKGVLSQYGNFSAVAVELAGQQFDGSCLACSGRSQVSEDLSFLYFQVTVVKCLCVSKCFCQLVYFDCVCHGFCPPYSLYLRLFGEFCLISGVNGVREGMNGALEQVSGDATHLSEEIKKHLLFL